MPKPVVRKEIWADAALLFPPYSTFLREMYNNMESLRNVVKPRLQDDWGTNNFKAKKKKKKNVVKVMKKKRVAKVMKKKRVAKAIKILVKVKRKMIKKVMKVKKAK